MSRSKLAKWRTSLLPKWKKKKKFWWNKKEKPRLSLATDLLLFFFFLLNDLKEKKKFERKSFNVEKRRENFAKIHDSCQSPKPPALKKYNFDRFFTSRQSQFIKIILFLFSRSTFRKWKMLLTCVLKTKKP